MHTGHCARLPASWQQWIPDVRSTEEDRHGAVGTLALFGANPAIPDLVRQSGRRFGLGYTVSTAGPCLFEEMAEAIRATPMKTADAVHCCSEAGALCPVV